MPLKITLFILACALCWYPMMVFHELGHILAALVTGGTLVHVELTPWSFSRTDISPNPHPLITVWAGPILGSLLPFLFYMACSALVPISMAFLLRTLGIFFTGFCLIANGAYISLGSFDNIGDAGEMLRLGTPPSIMHTFGILCFTAGLACWHHITKPDPDLKDKDPSNPPST